MFDIIVIGAGFFGCHIALKNKLEGKNVLVIDKNSNILTEASFHNQARVHKGYHYPRALETASLCIKHYNQFLEFYKPALTEDIKHLYAISSINSKTNYKDYLKFLDNLKIPFKEKEINIFKNIEGVVEVDEAIFDPNKLNKFFKEKNLNFELKTEVIDIIDKKDYLEVICKQSRHRAKKVYYCGYAHTNIFLKKIGFEPLDLEFQMTETCLVEPPKEDFQALTVMDGPFFSIMPFPAFQCYSLTHVEHGIHSKNDGSSLLNPSTITNFSKMLSSVSCFSSSLKDLQYLTSFYITKVIQKNDLDERPILIKKYFCDKLEVILGSKLVNIFEEFPIHP